MQGLCCITPFSPVTVIIISTRYQTLIDCSGVETCLVKLHKLASKNDQYCDLIGAIAICIFFLRNGSALLVGGT